MNLRWENKALEQCTPGEVLEFSKLRTDVFFLEQHITEEEIDRFDFDPHTRHIWCVEDDRVIGYVRVVHNDEPATEDQGVPTSIGRLVVDALYRGAGVARGLMTRALESAGDVPVVLHAQTYIEDFYASLGFEPFGEVFDEAGIDHVRMIRPATQTPQ